jgi:hypothetical protein
MNTRPLTGYIAEVTERRVRIGQARARRLQMGRLGSMKPGYSAPHCVAGVVLFSTVIEGLGRQFEVGIDDRANELSWWWMFSASGSVRAGVPLWVGRMLVAGSR